MIIFGKRVIHLNNTFKGKQTKDMSTKKLTSVKESPLFKGLTDEEFGQLFPIFDEKNVTEGKTVFVENMPGESLYVIESGTIKISKMLSEGDENILVTLGKGEIFGEMAVLDGAPRSATARVVEEASLLFVKKTDFDLLCEKSPKLGIKLVKNIVSNFAQRIRQNNEDFRQMLIWCQDRKN